MNEIKAICIFCGHTNKEVSFNREHIIPQSIGGNLFLDDCVCTKCNSFLGTKVDSDILKLPEILTAFERLSIVHDKEGIINRNYEITGKTEDNLEFKYGRIKGGKIIFPTQKMPDGSIIAPENEYKKNLKNIVKKDERLINAGLSENFIDRKLDELISKYEESKLGDKTNFPELGITLLKRDDKPLTTISPMKDVNLLPLMAKIAYEFIFFTGGALFFKDENIELQEQLIHSINSGKQENGLYFMREKSFEDDYKFQHYIFLEFYPDFTIVRVIFFGFIQYMIMGKKLSSEYKTNIENHIGLRDITRFSYQQVLDRPSKSFWVDTANGEKKCTAWID